MNFAPKGGPKDLKGVYVPSDDAIHWSDGNTWRREREPSFGAGWAVEAEVTLLSQAEAAKVDAALMSQPGFSVASLMELSGIAVAAAVVEMYPPSRYPAVVGVIGPGGNGGDGMVACRHLASMGYSSVVAYYPKRSKGALYEGLIASAEMMGVEMVDTLPAPRDDAVVLDAVFGFSFKPPLRAPFGELLQAMGQHSNIVAVDVPSGWDVDRGPPADATDTTDTDAALRPDVLVSLMAPKRCAKAYRGSAHFLGNVALPPKIALEHGLKRPAFHGTQQVLRLPNPRAC